METQLEIIRGDITRIEVDAIVNAANSSLLGGGGVDGAIHRAGGPEILDECRKIRARQGGCQVGEAVYTTAGQLPARYVIHTVGPVWTGKQPEGMKTRLAGCYTNSLRIAEELTCTTIAFPNISTGIYRFPKDLAAEVAIEAVRTYVHSHRDTFSRILFVCFDEENERIYRNLLS
ncbi:O-acetyl-ADP-ribose deacetylase [Pontibacter sp. G13]|uniref:O-acetyl-ADP-ribose deacetylase n=1 Tax=Pontibacter sp. G13 TaxID=3074898 RepID=UPI002889818E|nr:O-acetyl-ADP-ribose deacetylase [Pontibacter sp. G13]WNJ17241.1 O-acetyl-ADP-ribose deacetylase [Pontibacter sp. G13]